MLVLHQVEVYANAPIGCGGLVGKVSGGIFAVGLAIAKFHNGEILILQVHPQRSLILSVVAQSQL